MNTEYNQADKKARELADAQRTIEEYLRQEQSEISRKERSGMTLNDDRLSGERKSPSVPSYLPNRKHNR